MSFAIIDLNDTNIRVSANEKILVDSPGYAVIKDKQIIFGLAAKKLAHLYPRNTYNDFWHKLNQKPIQSISNQIRHNADLAYMHLVEIYKQIGKPLNCLIAVPSNFNPEQLALLLGLLKAANVHTVKLINNALLASINSLNQGKICHLDIQLHQSVLTYIETGNSHKLTTSEIIPELGMLTIYEQCAKLISNEFINQSRFDPLHNAETEQLLYAKIAECLDKQPLDTVIKLEIEYHENYYSANIKRETVLEKLLPFYNTIYKYIERSGQFIFSHRFNYFPWFFERVDVSNILILDEHALFTSAKLYTEFLHYASPNTNYISELPIIKTVPKSLKKNKQITTDITHILIKDMAYSLDKQDYFLTAGHQIETSLNKHSHYSIQFNNGYYWIQTENSTCLYLNGIIIDRKTILKLGDQIKTLEKDSGATLIKVN